MSSGDVAGVTGGTPDDGDPEVVAIVFSDDPSQLRCTGTVIAERVVLTAAHCDVDVDPAAYTVFFGSQVGAAGDTLAILDGQAHPDFDETESHDLALLLLAGPAPTGARPMLEAVPPTSLRLVGFGDTSGGAADAGRKREGTTQVTEVTALSLTLGPDPSLPCNGDSGGPALAASGEIAAVVSRGDASCATYGKATRVDAHLASFIEPYVAATAPGAVGVGDACLYDEHCTTGSCLEASDEPLLHFCGQDCEADGDCPEAMACEDGACRYPAPSPGALGAACGNDGDCVRGECAPDGICALRCISGVDTCPDGEVCTHLGGIDFFCAAPPAGGCCDAAGWEDPAASLVLVIVVAIGLLRHHGPSMQQSLKSRHAASQ